MLQIITTAFPFRPILTFLMKDYVTIVGMVLYHTDLGGQDRQLAALGVLT